MGLISFIRDFNKPVDIPQVEKDAIMAKAIADYDAEMEALDEWSNDPNNLDLGTQSDSPSFAKLATAAAVGVAVGNAVSK